MGVLFDMAVYHAARAILDFNEGVQDRFARALEAATENYNAAQATGMKVGDGGVQNMYFGEQARVKETSSGIKLSKSSGTHRTITTPGTLCQTARC